MSTAWGKTGRVTLDAAGYTHVLRVMVDGKKVGAIVGHSGSSSAWDCEIPGLNGPGWAWWWDGVAPNRDAAIMWVLRRAAPKVWREERPVVWKAYRHSRRYWLADRVTGPEVLGGAWSRWPYLVSWAHDRAREELASR